MIFTTAQAQTFRDAVATLALPGGPLANAIAIGDDIAVADYFNAAGTPAVKVWKPKVTGMELNTAVVWADYAAMAVALQNTYMAMTQFGSIDMTDTQVRQGISAIFPAGPSRTAIVAVSQRDATRLEALFGVTAGAAKVTPFFGQVMNDQDVARVLRGGFGGLARQA